MKYFFEVVAIFFLIHLVYIYAENCQQDAEANLIELSQQDTYGWCEVNQDLKAKLTWFDEGRSFAFAAWMNPYLWSFKQINHGQSVILTTHAISFIIASVIANTFVLFFHFSHSPHPKFSFTAFSKIIIRTHIYSGAIGVGLPIFVFFNKDESIGRIAMFVVCGVDYLFAYTARIQAPNVYGVRNLTIPLYNTCILLKFILNSCLLQSLLIDPIGGYKTQVQWLWICWVLHQTYAWVRVWYMFFVMTETMTSHRYTISVMLAGFMCINYSIGFIAVMMTLVTVILHYVWLDAKSAAILKQAKEELKKTGRISSHTLAKAGVLATMWDETKLDVFTNRPDDAERALQRCLEMNINPINPNIAKIVTQSTKAKFLFDTINVTKSGYITTEELASFFMEFGVTETTKAAIKMLNDADDNKNNTIELGEFEKHFSAFYVYAFNDLMRSIQHANRASNRNMLYELSKKEARLRIQSIRHCPFMSERRNTTEVEMPTSVDKGVEDVNMGSTMNDLDDYDEVRDVEALSMYGAATMRSISNSSFRTFAKHIVEEMDAENSSM